MLSTLHTFFSCPHAETNASNIIISILQVKKLKPSEVKEPSQGLTALGGGRGSKPQQQDTRAKLLTTGPRNLWGVGSSPSAWLSLTAGLYQCQLFAFHSGGVARCGSSMRSLTKDHLMDHPPWAQCVPSGSSLEPKWLCVGGPCDCTDKRGTQKLYLLKQQN